MYNAPTDVRVEGLPIADGTLESPNLTKKLTIRITADMAAKPTETLKRRVEVAFYPTGYAGPGAPTARNPTYVYSAWYSPSYSRDNLPVPLGTLPANSLYFARVYIRRTDNEVTIARSGYFWTDRSPDAPDLLTPILNEEIAATDFIEFTWTFTDPDESTVMGEYRWRWRVAATPTQPAGIWSTEAHLGPDRSLVKSASIFPSGNQIEWQVQVADEQAIYGDWSQSSFFYVLNSTTPPVVLSPVNDEAVVASDPVEVTWQFRDPQQGDTQQNANLRYRQIGTITWTQLDGVPVGTIYSGDPPFGAGRQDWTFAPDTFMAGLHYELQVQTMNSLLEWSDWSQSATFWTTVTPGSGVPGPPTFTSVQAALGCGINRAYIYDRGGMVRRGEVAQVSGLLRMQWTRRRDDISTALLTTNGVDADCGALLRDTHCWMHELVIERDGVRVWEGPITRLTFFPDGNVEIEARDVMAYLYRRILRQGYNDAYRLVGGVQKGLKSVVYRATRTTLNALAYDDPNVLPYLTSFQNPDDARESRVVPQYSRTAWEDVDDLAATAGLDYTVVGRRIMYWDTHRNVGLLPEMGGDVFADPPIVTEYGMQAANVFGVTNNAGIYGLADRITGTDPGPLGYIEQLASAYGEEAGAATDEVLTNEAKAALEATLTAQAERNIAGRWPTPIIVRVPDGTTLNPDVNLGINQLVPGVWIPLRAVGNLRPITQVQKLDAVTVTQSAQEGEKIAVTMSPAPGTLTDPDAEGGGEDG